MTSDWKTISVSRSAIAFENDRSYKLRTCQSCAYPGYELWVSKRLMKPDYTGRYELVYQNGFDFTLRKYSEKRFGGYELVYTKTIKGAELPGLFSDEYYTRPLIHEPPTLEPEEPIVPEDLLDL
jgi:hypothetical protein